jgi:hypothetical protein
MSHQLRLRSEFSVLDVTARKFHKIMLQHYLPGSFRLAPAKSEKVGTAIILLSFALPRGYRDHQGKDSRRNVVSIFFPLSPQRETPREGGFDKCFDSTLLEHIPYAVCGVCFRR